MRKRLKNSSKRIVGCERRRKKQNTHFLSAQHTPSSFSINKKMDGQQQQQQYDYASDRWNTAIPQQMKNLLNTVLPPTSAQHVSELVGTGQGVPTLTIGHGQAHFTIWNTDGSGQKLYNNAITLTPEEESMLLANM
jgi:hypothetical protein